MLGLRLHLRVHLPLLLLWLLLLLVLLLLLLRCFALFALLCDAWLFTVCCCCLVLFCFCTHTLSHSLAQLASPLLEELFNTLRELAAEPFHLILAVDLRHHALQSDGEGVRRLFCTASSGAVRNASKNWREFRASDDVEKNGNGVTGKYVLNFLPV